MRIGVDLMGCDASPKELFQAVWAVAQEAKSLQFVVYLTEDVATSLVGLPIANIDMCFVQEVISPEDDPLTAIRLKKDSSIVVGIQQLQKGVIDAFVSSGNTGALVAYSAIALPPLPGVDRPALLSYMPTKERQMIVVDVGGNIHPTPEQLAQYVHLGAAFHRATTGASKTAFGLLNIGIESKKGTQQVRRAFALMQELEAEVPQQLQFLGNLEGREVFSGKADLLICDGFTGNIFLKVAEGLSSLIFEAVRASAEIAQSEQLDQLEKKFMYEEYPGALVCGVKGIVMKCHGAATQRAMEQSIHGAIRYVEQDLIEKLC